MAICDKCGKEFIPKYTWQTICYNCYIDKVNNKKEERFQESIKLCPPDPMRSSKLKFGKRKGYSLWDILLCDREYFEFLVKISGSPECTFNQSLKDEILGFQKAYKTYIIKEAFMRLRRHLKNDEAPYYKGIHAIGAEYGYKDFNVYDIMGTVKISLNFDGYASPQCNVYSNKLINLLRRKQYDMHGPEGQYECYMFY